MSDIGERLDLFKAEWIREPSLLRASVKAAKLNDTFTAEISAWCAEIHEHLRELAGELEMDLMLMGGNAASLRFDAVKQRGSRDNDYLTTASEDDVERLMQALADRFAVIDGYLTPALFTPKNPVRELNMISYLVPVPLRLNHGKARDNNVKIEFHFEEELPPHELVTGELGPARGPMTAWLAQLPYQIVLKLMTLAADPVGIDEERRAAAVPHQMYDLDLLVRSVADAQQWNAMTEYGIRRYARECKHWDAQLNEGEPWNGIEARLLRWANCTDVDSEIWKIIRATQQSQLRRPVHLLPWGWRARAFRLVVVSECMRLGDGGWKVWCDALRTAALVPATKTKPFKRTLAELAAVSEATLPTALYEFIWQALAAPGSDVASRVQEINKALTSLV